jgi:GNAT superfamily N-acetyltransferase
VNVLKLTPELANLCERQFSQIGWTKPEGYFTERLDEQNSGGIILLVASVPGQYVGHALLVWNPDYDGFKEAGIPEIQDLNVLPGYREQGVGTDLIARLESFAAERSPRVGIGVGLHPGYNNAQKLYPKLGYIPDGRGVHYDNAPVVMGEHYRFDDELVLFFTKILDPQK